MIPDPPAGDGGRASAPTSGAGPEEAEERLAELFWAAGELAPEEARAYLREQCPDDETLRREVLSLLAFSPASEDLVEGTVGGALQWLGREDEDGAMEGRTFGPYRILRELGRGGLGRVFLAERQGGDFELQVALKIIDRVLASPLEKARFEQERRILASLSHPHIAQIFDGGATEDGTPFFVMEWVRGVPLDAYCDGRALSLAERIRIFLKVAEAVAHAHRNLIIHRDLKPSNILVLEDGSPKLLDFGIAKVLEEGQEAGRPELTRTGELLLTPDYASPEQVRGEALTTATDVYALGVLLFRLLTGRPPHRLKSYRPSEIERVLCRQPAPLASQSLGPGADGEEALEVQARRRGLSPARWRKALKGDLDRILATALSKDPGRRYASVEQLAGDLRSFLAGRPVSARGDSITYRTGMFVRRHRLAVTAGALVLASLLAGLVSTSILLRSARLEQARTAQVADFMVSLFEAADPAVARGEEISARQLLDRGADDLLRRRSLERSPQVRSTLLATVGRVYRHLGLYPQAEELLLEALTSHRRFSAATDPEVVGHLNDLGQLYDAWEDHEKALAYLEEARAVEPSPGTSRPVREGLRARTLFLMASVELDRHEYAAALEHLEGALRLRRRHFPEESPEVAEIRHSQAQVWYRQGRLEEARETLEEVLALRRSLLGEDHPLVLTTYNDLATVFHDQGDLGRALPLLQQTVAVRKRLLGEEHPYVATVLLNLATVARKSGERQLAEESLREALKIHRRAFGEAHPRIAENLEALARLAHGEGRLEEADRLYRQALEMRRSLLGPEHLDVARSLLALADLQRSRGFHDSAEDLYRRCLAIQEKVLGPEDLRLSFALLPLGRLLRGEGRAREALPLLERALTLRRGLAQDHRLRVEGEAELGLTWAAVGDGASARPHLRAALAALRSRGAGESALRPLEEALEELGPPTEDRRDLRSPIR